jgi:GntR family transcriptional regulator
MVINHRSDRPAYQQIADVLRERIRDGVYAAGSKVPSETELLAEFGVTRQTVRRGLAVLAREGLTEASRGRGVFVRQAPPVLTMRTARFSRAARRAGNEALAVEAVEELGLEWRSEDLGTEIVDAAPDVRRALGEDQAAVKRCRMWVGGVPTQLTDSYIPASIDARIGWTAGAPAPGGIYGLLEQHGYEIRRFREELAARQATPEESVALELPAAAPVVVLVRHAIDGSGRVVER